MIRIPDFLSHLDVDPRRKLPIPWSNVRLDDGTPDFTTIDAQKQLVCARGRRCAVCGFKIEEQNLCFLGGPKSVRSRIYHDPPMHEQCARYAGEVCPFIAVPGMLRRKHGSTGELPSEAAGERPKVFVLYCTTGYSWDITLEGYVVFTARRAEWIEVLEGTRSES